MLFLNYELAPGTKKLYRLLKLAYAQLHLVDDRGSSIVSSCLLSMCVEDAILEFRPLNSLNVITMYDFVAPVTAYLQKSTILCLADSR